LTSFEKLGESPVETLSFKFQKFDFDSWVKIIQLNAIRDALGQGLSVHFEVCLFCFLKYSI
jgi:hypothetical protein